MIERLLNNEKILTLVYDKTFYPDMKNIDYNVTGNASGLEMIKENDWYLYFILINGYLHKMAYH